jgi:hypothetical protein
VVCLTTIVLCGKIRYYLNWGMFIGRDNLSACRGLKPRYPKYEPDMLFL